AAARAMAQSSTNSPASHIPRVTPPQPNARTPRLPTPKNLALPQISLHKSPLPARLLHRRQAQATEQEGPRVAELDLASIYAIHRQGLFTHALSITRSVERAEDALHDAIARLVGRDAADITDPIAYVFAAVRTSAIDQNRKAQRPEPPDAIFVADVVTPDAHAIRAEQADSVIAAVGELSVENREVVVLRIYAGLTFAQIAEITGEPLPTVASRYRRSLERLKQQLEKLV